MASIETKISKGATIKGLEEGNIKFGYGCMIHPYSKIITEGGSSIIFGDYNIIEEGVLIKACPKMNSKNRKRITKFNIQVIIIIKVGAEIINTSVQDYNIIDYRAKVVNGFIESKTILAPLAEVKEGKILKTSAVILPNNKLMINSTFDEDSFKNNIKKLSRVLEHLFHIPNTKK